MIALNPNKDKQEKLNHLFFLKGKNQISTQEIVSGDIGAVSKLQYTATGDTLCSEEFKVMYDKIKLCQWQYYQNLKVMKKKYHYHCQS